PAPEPPLVIESEMDRYRREAEDFERKRAAFKAERRAEERAVEDLRRADANDLEDRVSGLEERMDAVEALVTELARSTVAFSDAVDSKLADLSSVLTKIRDGENTMLGKHEREYARLRDEFASERSIHARELALVSKQLAECEAALARADDRREHKRDREQFAKVGEATVIELQALRRDLAERGGAA